VSLDLPLAKTADIVLPDLTTPPERRGSGKLLLLLPGLLFLGVFFGYPLLDILVRSVHTARGLSLENYARFFDTAVYGRVLLVTLELSFEVTVICLAIGYPLAYVIANARGAEGRLMLVLVLLPFLTSILARTYAWMVILRPDGLLADAVSWLVGRDVSLIYNSTGVLIGMVYTMLPYMVLTLVSVMRGIDARLVHVAGSLGAGRFAAFRRVYLPLSMPGIVGGCLLVFILSSGFFITPRLMGGGRDQMLASIVAYQVDTLVNWSFASALAVVLLAITLVCFLVYARLVGLKQLLSSKW
jgi:ABC-type spermidine/putrescine transport system permease subunit I